MIMDTIKSAKNGPIINKLVATYIKIKFKWGSILWRNIKTWTFQKIVNNSEQGRISLSKKFYK